jgi:hypothetical protein
MMIGISSLEMMVMVHNSSDILWNSDISYHVLSLQQQVSLIKSIQSLYSKWRKIIWIYLNLNKHNHPKAITISALIYNTMKYWDSKTTKITNSENQMKQEQWTTT